MKDVIIVLGCEAEFISRDRVRKAVDLFNNGFSENVIMSGKYSFSSDKIPKKTEAQVMKEYAKELGLSNENVFLEEESTDTIGNAYFSKIKYLKSNNWKDIIVITTDIHVDRAKFIFEFVLGLDYKVEVIGVKSDIPKGELEKRVDYERKVVKILKDWLKDIKPGDDETIKKFLYEDHPGYAKNPKFTKETLMELIKKIK